MDEPKEGVTKFQLVYTHTQPNIPASYAFQELQFWRKRLYQSKLIGQDSNKYDGAGYGNVSCKVPPFVSKPNEQAFLITGTQTGNLSVLTQREYALVTSYYPEQNMVVAQGPIRPSAESMTHGMIYDVLPYAMFVFHAHSPDIWQNAATLGIPATNPHVGYGTPEMALEVKRLNDNGLLEKRILSMGGHEDGIISFGETAEIAGEPLIQALTKAKDLR